MNNLTWLINPLNKYFPGQFLITPRVRAELIDRPLTTKKYKFEALQMIPYILDGSLKVYNAEKVKPILDEILTLGNHLLKARDRYLTLVHPAEMEVIATAVFLKAKAVVIDERTARELLEDPDELAHWMSRKLKCDVRIDQESLKRFRRLTKGIRVIRSAELVTVAYELGLLNRYVMAKEEKIIPDLQNVLLESVLWGVKLNGCSISRDEISQIRRMER